VSHYHPSGASWLELSGGLQKHQRMPVQHKLAPSANSAGNSLEATTPYPAGLFAALKIYRLQALSAFCGERGSGPLTLSRSGSVRVSAIQGSAAARSSPKT